VFTNANTSRFGSAQLLGNTIYDESRNKFIAIYNTSATGSTPATRYPSIYSPYGQSYEVISSTNGTHWTSEGTISEDLIWTYNKSHNAVLYTFGDSGKVKAV
jgi:hypothetical protein